MEGKKLSQVNAMRRERAESVVAVSAWHSMNRYISSLPPDTILHEPWSTWVFPTLHQMGQALNVQLDFR